MDGSYKSYTLCSLVSENFCVYYCVCSDGTFERKKRKERKKIKEIRVSIAKSYILSILDQVFQSSGIESQTKAATRTTIASSL